MNIARSKSIEVLEEKMQAMDDNSVRYHVLEAAKNFKSSWIDLGRALYSVLKDKLYKDWGYSSFDIYTAKEIGIRKQTAMKLLRSYYFLEKEEPVYLKQEASEAQTASAVPSFESIDVLRMAKAKKIDEDDYQALKQQVFEKGRDARDVKKDLTALIRQRAEVDPEEAREKRKVSTVRRFVGTLKALKQELQINKLLPAPLLRETEELIKKLEAQL
ncbi:MAG: hypothetical protein PHS09_03420 [Candidatus Omnitrophica bacterium]|nr:hypothetical protein [Candidatus Omnitrophota bacterium]MDD5512327.1 hypothetical protein [Candidatus Omnitrophota bacterium]